MACSPRQSPFVMILLRPSNGWGMCRAIACGRRSRSWSVMAQPAHPGRLGTGPPCGGSASHIMLVGQQCKLWDLDGNTIELRCYTTPSYTHQGGHDMALTLAEAHRMMQAARAKAEELHVTLSVAVCDAGGNLLAFNRMEGASAVITTVAQGKAAASAGVGRPSGALAADSPVIQSIIATLGGACCQPRGP